MITLIVMLFVLSFPGSRSLTHVYFQRNHRICIHYGMFLQLNILPDLYHSSKYICGCAQPTQDLTTASVHYTEQNALIENEEEAKFVNVWQIMFFFCKTVTQWVFFSRVLNACKLPFWVCLFCHFLKKERLNAVTHIS